jgi:hypothetical protein
LPVPGHTDSPRSRPSASGKRRGHCQMRRAERRCARSFGSRRPAPFICAGRFVIAAGWDDDVHLTRLAHRAHLRGLCPWCETPVEVVQLRAG